MLRNILLMGAVAAPLVLGSQLSASAMSLVTTQASSTIEVDGTEYNVFFNQGSDGRTSFNDVFGVGIPSLTFTTFNEAQTAANAIVAAIPFSEFSPGSTTGTEFFEIPFAATSSSFQRIGGEGREGRRSSANASAVSESRSFQFGNRASFVTFAEVSGGEDATAVPTPALLPGLIGMGFSAIRKRRNLAQSDDA